MSKGQSLQDPFLNALRRERVPVSIYLVNGIKLQGTITRSRPWSRPATCGWVRPARAKRATRPNKPLPESYGPRAGLHSGLAARI